MLRSVGWKALVDDYFYCTLLTINFMQPGLPLVLDGRRRQVFVGSVLYA